MCSASLLNAADALGSKAAFDGQLSLAHHLLLLRDIVRSVDRVQKESLEQEDPMHTV